MHWQSGGSFTVTRILHVQLARLTGGEWPALHVKNEENVYGLEMNTS